MEAATHPRRVQALDSLRGIAALLVVLYHYSYFAPRMVPGVTVPDLQLSWGDHGVQLFYAISGFVILMSLERTRAARDFIHSRFWRLFPSYWLAIAITTIGVALLGPVRLATAPVDTLLNLPMLQLWTNTPMVDGVYWTLNIELAFYAAMLGMWRLRWLDRIERVTAGWLALTWLWFAVPALSEKLGLALIVDQIPFFCVGVLAYRVWSGARSAWQQAPSVALVVLTVGVTAPIDSLVTVFVLLVLFGVLAHGGLDRLAQPPLLWLGAISYPLYLIHANIGYGVIAAAQARGLGATSAMLLAIAVSLALAATIRYGFERPLERFRAGRRRARPARFAAA